MSKAYFLVGIGINDYLINYSESTDFNNPIKSYYTNFDDFKYLFIDLEKAAKEEANNVKNIPKLIKENKFDTKTIKSLRKIYNENKNQTLEKLTQKYLTEFKELKNNYEPNEIELLDCYGFKEIPEEILLETHFPVFDLEINDLLKKIYDFRIKITELGFEDKLYSLDEESLKFDTIDFKELFEKPEVFFNSKKVNNIYEIKKRLNEN